MALYKYTAMSGEGKTVRGSLRADSLTAFYAELKRGDLYCMKVGEESEAPILEKLFGKPKLPRTEIAVFCRQMASMIATGVAINRCIDVIYSQCGHPKTKIALAKLYEQMQKGNQLSAAMEECDGAFDLLIINMVRAGENSGTLDRSLARLADYYERETKLKNKITLAMLYPIILSVVAFGVIVVLFVVVLPSFITMFQSVRELPWSTRMLMWISNFLVERWYIVLALTLGIIAGSAALAQNPSFQLWRDRVKLQIPFAGRLQIRIVSARFCRVFASLYTGGIHILEALELSGGVLNNRYIEMILERVSNDVRKGTSLSAALKKQNMFPKMMISMLMAGEESGELDDMLIKISDFYDEEADAAMQELIGMLQPVMIVILGVLIAFVMMSVLTPIYSMYQNI